MQGGWRIRLRDVVHLEGVLSRYDKKKTIAFLVAWSECRSIVMVQRKKDIFTTVRTFTRYGKIESRIIFWNLIGSTTFFTYAFFVNFHNICSTPKIIRAYTKRRLLSIIHNNPLRLINIKKVNELLKVKNYYELLLARVKWRNIIWLLCFNFRSVY